MELRHFGKTAIVVVALLVLGLPAVFATGGSEQNAAGGNATVTPAGTFPVVKNKVTIHVFATLHPYTGDLTINWFTKYYEDKTNVHIEWEQVPDEQAAEKLNVMFAAKELPDAILHGDYNFTNSQLMVNGKSGLFIPLNALIDKYDPALKAVLQNRPYVASAITAPDGNIYSYPAIGECFHCVHEVRAFIYKPWLDKLGLNIPTTTDELENVLMAFKTRDPNGNGKADVIPMSGAIANGGYNNQIDLWPMNAFIYTYYEEGGDRSFVQVDNNKVSFVANTPQWRDGLRYLRKLYSEGLIDPESFTQTRTDLKQKDENPDYPLVGFVPSGSISAITIYLGASGRYKNWELVPPLKGPSGFQVAYTGPYRILPKFEITSAAKNPDVIARWADWFYTEEGTVTSSTGQEGTGWRKANAGELNVEGKQASYFGLLSYGRKNDFNWGQNALGDQSVQYANKWALDPKDYQGPILYNAAILYDKYRPQQYLPYLWYSPEDSAAVADVSVAILNYVVSSDAEFITGRRNLEGSDWNDYLAQLDALGVAKYVGLVQKSWDSVKK